MPDDRCDLEESSTKSVTMITDLTGYKGTEASTPDNYGRSSGGKGILARM